MIKERLKAAREAVGLTQVEVAEAEGLSEQYISQLERGVNNPRGWPLLRRLAKRYNISADYLLGLTDDPAPKNSAELPSLVRHTAELARELSTAKQDELLRITRVLLQSEREMLWRFSALQERFKFLGAIMPDDLDLILVAILQEGAERDGFRQLVASIPFKRGNEGVEQG